MVLIVSIATGTVVGLTSDGEDSATCRANAERDICDTLLLAHMW